jgi:hypothetical protein
LPFSIALKVKIFKILSPEKHVSNKKAFMKLLINAWLSVSQKLQISNHFLDDLKRLADLFAA